MAKSQLRVDKCFPIISQVTNTIMNLKNWFWLTDRVFKNHNFNQFQSFQVCPSFSPFVFAMILLRYDTLLFFSCFE